MVDNLQSRHGSEEQIRAIITYEQTDIIKGIAILLVVITHLGAHFTRVFTPLGGIGVALFLTISAYGLEKTFEKNYKCGRSFGIRNYWRKRVITVFIPYLLCECVYFTITGWKISRIDFILDALLIKPKFSIGWYLNYLLLWYVIFWLVHVIQRLNRNTQIRLKVYGIVSIVLAIYFNFSSPIRFEQSFSFLLGCVLACLHSEVLKNFQSGIEKVKSVKGVCLFLIIAVFILGIKQLYIVRQMPQAVLNMMDLMIKMFSLSGILDFVLLAFNPSIATPFWNNVKKPFIWIGKVSFELYLIHGYALVIFDSGLKLWTCALVFLIMSTVGTVCFYSINKVLRSKLENALLYKHG